MGALAIGSYGKEEEEISVIAVTGGVFTHQI
jgi:hypothetical protein